MCRLDMFLGSKLICDNSKRVTIFSSMHSDHKGVCLCLKFQSAKRGPGFCKFNSSVLKNKEFTDFMPHFIDKTWEFYMDITDRRMKYDLLQFHIVEKSVFFFQKK